MYRACGAPDDGVVGATQFKEKNRQLSSYGNNFTTQHNTNLFYKKSPQQSISSICFGFICFFKRR